MSDLTEAIAAEALGDFTGALEHYSRLTESGSPLDRVGILQALARCAEKLGRLKDAGGWRRKAGQAYRALRDEEMKADERDYLALVEYRNAVQDLHGDASLPAVAKEYSAVLKDNFSAGAEGLTHDWNWILSELSLRNQAEPIGRAVFVLGVVVLLAALALLAYDLLSVVAAPGSTDVLPSTATPDRNAR